MVILKSLSEGVRSVVDFMMQIQQLEARCGMEEYVTECAITVAYCNSYGQGGTLPILPTFSIPKPSVGNLSRYASVYFSLCPRDDGGFRRQSNRRLVEDLETRSLCPEIPVELTPFWLE